MNVQLMSVDVSVIYVVIPIIKKMMDELKITDHQARMRSKR